MPKLWGGRFEKSTDKQAESFHSSIGFDCRLYQQDIEGSIAHATMLGRTGIIGAEDAEKIVSGLKEVFADIEAGHVAFDSSDEDIHMAVERLLTQKIGEAGKKLHTGRSRNDQVALDTRLYMKETISNIAGLLKALLQTLSEKATQHLNTPVSAYTHLQKAQPTTLAHYLMAYFEMFKRDALRFADCLKRTDAMPLGSGAVCATTYPLDREMVKSLLGFAELTDNSMDAVSDRDYLLEFLSCASITMMHLSRFCEELILWAAHEFGYVTMDDAYSTGSSIMPQKKNPDMAELIRGKTGRVYGSLMALLTTMKGLPLAYNKDMQEDKEAVFDAADTLKACLGVFTGMLKTLKFNTGKMRTNAAKGFANATDAADYLVKKGLPFRDAHEITGKLVLLCEGQGKAIEDLALAELKTLSPVFEADVYEAISLEPCIANRKVYGGPAPDSMKQHLEKTKAFLDSI